MSSAAVPTIEIIEAATPVQTDLSEKQEILNRLAAATAAYGASHNSCNDGLQGFVANAAGITSAQAKKLLNGGGGTNSGAEVTITFKYRVNVPVNVASAKQHLANVRDQEQAAAEFLTGSRYGFGTEGHSKVTPLSLDATIELV